MGQSIMKTNVRKNGNSKIIILKGLLKNCKYRCQAHKSSINILIHLHGFDSFTAVTIRCAYHQSGPLTKTQRIEQMHPLTFSYSNITY